jgi:hypothetical protein
MSVLLAMLGEADIRGEINRGHLTTLTHIGPLWENTTMPEGLTGFACRPWSDTTSSSSDRAQELKTSLNAIHNNHIDDDDLTFLAAKDY